MSAFKQLKDVSNNFEQQLRRLCIYSVKNNETFEDKIAKKMRDLTLRTSKLRLLKAKQIAALPQNTTVPPSGDTIKEYGDVAMWKVLEQAIVKSLTQSHAVKTLITTADENLDPEMLERKEKIVQSLKEYRHVETVLRENQVMEEAREEELAVVRKEWDEELTRLRELQEVSEIDECDISGPLYDKLRKVVSKLEMMRWLMCRLVTSRTAHDWLAAPEHTGRALALTRKHYSDVPDGNDNLAAGERPALEEPAKKESASYTQ